MSIDWMNGTIGGRSLMGLAAYATVSMFVTGPEVASRTIARDRIVEACQQSHVEDHRATTRSAPDLSSLSCESVMKIFGPQGRAFCDLHGKSLGLDLDFGTKDAHRRMTETASRANSACACGAIVVAGNRVDWATYAGSMRTVVPASIRNLHAEVTAASRLPLCRGRTSS